MKLKPKLILIFILSFALTLALIPATTAIVKNARHERMLKVAAATPRESDGAENLLVMNGDSGFVGSGSNVYAKYLEDGRIHIKGTSSFKTWKLLGNVELELGNYTLTGLSNVESGNACLEVEFQDDDGFWKRLSEDVGPQNESTFEVIKPLTAGIYVEVYEGCEVDAIAKPALYKNK